MLPEPSYENCIHCHITDNTDGANDCFDHPSYTYLCTTNGHTKTLISPSIQCSRCINRTPSNYQPKTN